MRTVDLIIKKRDGGALSTAEIDFLIAGYTQGTVAHEQMSALAMAIFFRGMDDRETGDLTLAMARSGDQLDLHDIAPLTVDKHSTGGIGDKTSLVLGPLASAAGMPMAKMSGRGLGFSGGTIDKLEAIPGFRTELSSAEFRAGVREIGLVIAAQSGDLAPADKRLYALRDVTGTVESIPLIAASVMSKKLAAGADCIVLDVKTGAGAFMRTQDDARALAERMVAIGQHAGRRVAAAITTMAQPLGANIGNALEVKEAIATLRGHGPADLVELCVALGAELAVLAGKAATPAAGAALMRTTLDSGAAWVQFRRFVANQGGDLRYVDEPERLPSAPVIQELPAPRSGVVAAINGEVLGMAVNELGGGRMRKEDNIDPAVGLVIAAKVGDRVSEGQPLLQIHAASAQAATAVAARLAAAYTIGDQSVAAPPLIYEVIR
ncbi:MAG: thymidine phosphorylase [Roseiflexaceae bacterium]|nr:thymidine phosphorylase [Roseiflexaceae bacterium]